MTKPGERGLAPQWHRPWTTHRPLLQSDRRVFQRSRPFDGHDKICPETHIDDEFPDK